MRLMLQPNSDSVGDDIGILPPLLSGLGPLRRQNFLQYITVFVICRHQLQELEEVKLVGILLEIVGEEE